jgi:hypothetical protein
VFQNEKLFKIFIWCLLKASHKEHEQLVGLQKITLQPGEFVYGRTKASEELKIKESTVNKYMSWLKKYEIINIKSNNKFSVISIVNWALYQFEVEESNSKSNNNVTTKEQQSNTNKNVKNDKNVKKLKDICGTSPQTHKFIPPIIDEIKTYCTERNNKVDPEKFHDFYTSKNWMIGKNKMKDWKAAVRTWEKENKQQTQSKMPQSGNFEQRQYSDDDFDKMYKDV